jgi:hypothetical protein
MSEPEPPLSPAEQEAARIASLLKAFDERGREEDLRDVLMRVLFGAALLPAPGYEKVWRELRVQLLALHTIANSGTTSPDDRFSRDEARDVLANLFRNEVQADRAKAIVNEAVLAGMADKSLGSQEKRATHLAEKVLPALYLRMGVADEHLTDEAIMKRWRRMKQDAKENTELEALPIDELRRRLHPRKYGAKKKPKPGEL